MARIIHGSATTTITTEPTQIEPICTQSKKVAGSISSTWPWSDANLFTIRPNGLAEKKPIGACNHKQSVKARTYFTSDWRIACGGLACATALKAVSCILLEPRSAAAKNSRARTAPMMTVPIPSTT